MNEKRTQESMLTSIPVACHLTQPELQERRSGVLRKMSRAVQEVVEQEDGFAYRFTSSDETLEDLFEIANLERKCCPFLRISVVVEPGHDSPVWLEMHGPEGTKDFLSSLFEIV